MVTVFVSVALELTELPVRRVVVLALTVAVLIVSGHHVVYTVAASLMVVVAVETIAGEAVSEQTPDSQEVTVIIVVCFVGSAVETGHHVVYSVVTPPTVVVAVETIAEVAVSEQTPDSQDVTVIKVVCSLVTVAVDLEGSEEPELVDVMVEKTMDV